VFVSLAPGLAMIKAPKLGKLELVDDKGGSLIAITASADKRALLPAPKPKAARHTLRDGRRYHQHLDLDLEAAPPATAVAVVLFDDKSKPKSFHLISNAATTITAYAAGGCTPLPNGTRPTTAGETVRVAFVDDVGRMSAISAPIKVTANTAKP
jgi:hypothetical protein